MNVNGIPPALARFAAAAAAAPARVREPHEIESKSAAERVAEAGGFDVREDASTLEPGALRSASLWEVLSPEERAFFADPVTLGALTYGANGTATAPAPAPVGQRVDFKA